MSIKLPLNQVQRKRLPEGIVGQLVSLIESGKLKFGSKLPPERKLMEQFGVGRSSVREAIGSLSLMGVLDVRPGSGTYVAVPQEDFLARPLNWCITMGPERFQELVEARCIVEEAIAGLAAQRADEAEIEEIRHCLTKMKTNQSNLRIILADLSFHITLAKASHNTILLNFLLQIRNLMWRWIKESRSVPRDNVLSIEEHGRIFSAIEARDVKRARSTMRRHLESGRSRLTSSMLVGRPSGTNP